MNDITCALVAGVFLIILFSYMYSVNKNPRPRVKELSILEYYQKKILERDTYICYVCKKEADQVSSTFGKPFDSIMTENTGMYLNSDSYGDKVWKSDFYNTTKEKFESNILPDLISICKVCKIPHERNYVVPVYQLVLERDNYTCKLCGSNAIYVVDLIKSEDKPMSLLDKNIVGSLYYMTDCISVCEKCRLENVSPLEFEKIIGRSFTHKGYSVSQVDGTGDGGVDLICVSPTQQKIIVQCKRYKGSVGSSVIRDFLGALVHNEAVHGYIVTTGYFTSQALEFAKNKNITLVDGKMITKFLIE